MLLTISLSNFMKGECTMSFLNACSFIFNSVNSTDYGVIIAWIDSAIDTSINGLNRQINKSTKITRVKNNIYGTEQTESISFTICIVKPNGTEISRQESININHWLTSSSLPQILKFNDRDSYSLHYYAICTNIKDIVIGGRLVGKELKFETNSSYAFSRKQEKVFEVDDSLVFSLNNSSDTYNGIYYPTITIMTQSDKIIIENMTDKKSLTIYTTNIPLNEEGYKIIFLNSEDMKILDKDKKLLPANKLGWDETYSSYISSIDKYTETIYWPRLLSGMNEIKIIGTCIFKISYEFPRKAGCL